VLIVSSALKSPAARRASEGVKIDGRDEHCFNGSGLRIRRQGVP
jgi:hypothetical protein